MLNNEKRTQNSIGKRLFKLILIVSFCLTLLFTFIQAWMDYHSKMESISHSMEQIERIHVEMIKTSLWSADKEQLRPIVEGMLNFPYVNYAGIIDQDNIVINAGVKRNGEIHQEIKLAYDYNGKNIILGTLIIQADKSKILSEVFKNITIMFLFQAGTIFIAAFMVFLLFERLVTRHLVAAAAHLTSRNIDSIDASLHLHKRNRHDEIDILLEAYNDMIEKLIKIYRDQEETLQELHQSEERFRVLVESIPQKIFAKDKASVYLSCNKLFAEEMGINPREIVGKDDFMLFPVELAEKYRADDQRIMAADQTETIEETYLLKGEERWARTTKTPLKSANNEIYGILGIYDDITEQKRKEQEKVVLQAQLSQSQKMEAVGRLAGGVAHDFNNMLSIIIGHAELAMDKFPPEDPMVGDLHEIVKAGKRSAELTRQLLAFARKQTIVPKILDLNDTIESMLKMLRRLISEDIVLFWKPASNLWPVKMDPTQLDQLLANLVINARDAIKDGGRVTIETDNRGFEEPYREGNTGLFPGEYVVLTVSDNGSGMDKETLENIFEPFFTTKELGKGTGLGLATVYGIVKQNDGFINVTSEPGQGSTFTIYIPRCRSTEVESGKRTVPAVIPTGSETVLLVEDEKCLLELGKTMLERLGYTVLITGSPDEAIRLAKTRGSEIHLLLTDVVMPGMNGRELANQLRTIHPRLKSLFMSGYSADVIAHHGVLDEDVHFIQKPFSRQGLAVKVRDVLDQA